MNKLQEARTRSEKKIQKIRDEPSGINGKQKESRSNYPYPTIPDMIAPILTDTQDNENRYSITEKRKSRNETLEETRSEAPEERNNKRKTVGVSTPPLVNEPHSDETSSNLFTVDQLEEEFDRPTV